ncbi:hypothetical protein [Bacillus phage FI_KG-Lek]|nr:hypothetical protein [Bacillus phage FI_KG-Lek]
MLNTVFFFLTGQLDNHASCFIYKIGFGLNYLFLYFISKNHLIQFSALLLPDNKYRFSPPCSLT